MLKTTNNRENLAVFALQTPSRRSSLRRFASDESVCSIASRQEDVAVGSTVHTESTRCRDIDPFLHRDLILVASSCNRSTGHRLTEGHGSCDSKGRSKRIHARALKNSPISLREEEKKTAEEGRITDNVGKIRNSVTFPSSTMRRSRCGHLRGSVSKEGPEWHRMHRCHNDRPSQMHQDWDNREERGSVENQTKYSLGDALRSNDDVMGEDEVSNTIEVHNLQKYDFAFVKRANGSFTYSVLADRYYKKIKKKGNREGSGEVTHHSSHDTEEVMLFVLDEEGHTKLVPKHCWPHYIRRIRPPMECVIFDNKNHSEGITNHPFDVINDNNFDPHSKIKNFNISNGNEPVFFSSPTGVEQHPFLALPVCKDKRQCNSLASASPPKSPVKFNIFQRIDSFPPLPLHVASDANSTLGIESLYSFGRFSPYDSNVGDVFWA